MQMSRYLSMVPPDDPLVDSKNALDAAQPSRSKEEKSDAAVAVREKPITRATALCRPNSAEALEPIAKRRKVREPEKQLPSQRTSPTCLDENGSSINVEIRCSKNEEKKVLRRGRRPRCAKENNASALLESPQRKPPGRGKVVIRSIDDHMSGKGNKDHITHRVLHKRGITVVRRVLRSAGHPDMLRSDTLRRTRSSSKMPRVQIEKSYLMRGIYQK